MRRSLLALAVLAVAVLAVMAFPRHLVSRAALSNDFSHFESGHVRPMALTPDGTRLLVVNTADARLAVFDLTGAAPVRVGEVRVGLEPVSVAARTNSEAWVVNHLSDDVSVVDLATLHVKATLKVGDEPSDVVFAGTPRRAFVSVSQEDAIKAYDPANLAAPPQVIAMPGRFPRALARDASGSRVFVAVLQGGNRTATLDSASVADSLPPPVPPMSPGLPIAPRVALIIRQDAAGDWRDETGKLWNAKAKFQMSESDVVELDADARTVLRARGDLATLNLGLDVNPLDGRVATTGTEARNAVRFEPVLRGHTVDTRLSLFTPAGAGQVVNLNPHVNYAVSPGPQSERDSALGMPTGVAWSADGQRVYVTSLATNKLGVLDGAGALLARVSVVEGPTGVLADGPRARLYVLGRFRNQLQTLSAATLRPIATSPVGFDPTPDEIVNGRRRFYGGASSGHGDQSCASCHLFGDLDGLAWDLGDPTGAMQSVPPGQVDPLLTGFHPMKGPMTTQTLRGIGPTGLLHWRGDRANLAAFNPAFVGLLGRASVLPDSEMTAFSDFTLALAHPPNPNQHLDRSFADAPAGQPSALRGRLFFLNTPVAGGLRCVQCHALPLGTNLQLVNRLALLDPQDMKIPQLRNVYRKTGFDKTPGVRAKRGFGFLHDGSNANLFEFLHFPGFSFAPGPSGDAQRRDVEAFLLAFDTGAAPAVGAQVTFDGGVGDAARGPRLDTLVTQAAIGNCDLVARGRVAGVPRGWKLEAGTWKPDRAGQPTLTSDQLRALAAAGSEVTVMGVPVGAGTRMALDRDRDTFLDGDELAAGSDPGNPASTPLNVGVPGRGPFDVALAPPSPNPSRGAVTAEFTLSHAASVDLAVYDVLGREVRALARGTRHEAGSHRVTWDGRDARGHAVGAGAYFVRLRADGRERSRTIVRVP